MSDPAANATSPSEPVFPSGEYAIEGVLGTGGMAVVYRARDLRRPRTVAIKVLTADVARLIGTDRFLREIAVTSGFTHPHILPLLDSGETTDALGRRAPYYVMPLLEGDTLADRIANERRLPVQDAIRLACEILEAIHYAHEQGVIHRDIKPANVLLSGGHAVVADFGVARPTPGSTRETAAGKALTEFGVIVGTPEYMSPEQALGDEKVDERADVYAVGCVLYEMLIGDSPFEDATAQRIASRKISGEFTPASIRRAGLPAELDDILAMALSADRSDRYASAADFLRALQRLDLRVSASGRVAVRRFAWPRILQPLALTVAGVAAVAALSATVLRGKSVNPTTEPTADKSRVAVLPLGVLAVEGSADLVANALTSDLIDELARYPALTVISKNGVLPFRGGAARADSVAQILKVGSIITGDVRSAGDSVKVTVRLVDGVTSAQLASVEAAGTRKDVLAVRSSIIDSVTSFLRRQIGREISAVAERTASNPEAWQLVAQVKQMRDVELQRSGANTTAARAARFAFADSQLARAVALDPQWEEPAAQRVSLLLLRAGIEELARTGTPAANMELARNLRLHAVALADSSLQRFPDDAGILYHRGRARFALFRSASPTAPDSLRSGAESDLRAAVTRRRDKAEVWNELSLLLHMSGAFEEARRAAEEAVRADAYLKSVESVYSRLFFSSLAVGRVEEARSWCAKGIGRYPNDPRFWQCDLTILGWTGSTKADVQAAWQSLAASESRDSSHVLASGWGSRRLFVAAVAARAGLRDSAQSILMRVRNSLPAGSSSGLNEYAEAYVQTLLGKPDLAIPLLEHYLQSNPALRGQVRRTPWFESLRSDQRFLAITSPQ